MSISTLAVALLLGQSAFSLAPDKTALDTTDVAYTELSAGKAQEAVRKLEAGGAMRSEDPAALINLGSAYARAGMKDKAVAAYQSAIASPDRYDLQLADGSWVDSRVAARMAMKSMTAARTMASR